MAICTKDCMIGMPSYASDGDCDGGGPGAEYLGCQLGTDCAECGPRFPSSSAHLRRDVQLGFRRRLNANINMRLRRRRPRLGVPPGHGTNRE